MSTFLLNGLGSLRLLWTHKQHRKVDPHLIHALDHRFYCYALIYLRPHFARLVMAGHPFRVDSHTSTRRRDPEV